MRRGHIVLVSAPGAYGKPRPAVVIQSDALNGADSVLLSLFTSAVIEAPFYRLTVPPVEGNGLKVESQVMVDKIVALPREKCSEPIGSLTDSEMVVLNRMLAVMIGIAD